MKLNEQSKQKLRASIEEMTKKVSEEERIHINKELLDDLLFKKKADCKIPIWSGEFLSKIDLSEISFEDVAWSTKGRPIKDKELSMIYYVNTNAHIDFEKSYEAKNLFDGYYILYRCDFSGTDLSNMNLAKLQNAFQCSFVGCNLSRDIFEMLQNGEAYECNFSNNNELYGSINLELFLDRFFANGMCNFTNTRINVVFSRDDEFCKENVLAELGGIVKSGLMDNCSINGKRILSLEEREKIKQETQKEYEIFEEQLLEKTVNDIEKQIVLKKTK